MNRVLVVSVGVLAMVSLSGSDRCAKTTVPRSAARSTVSELERLPLRFEENEGQWDAATKFVARGAHATLYLSDEGATIDLRTSETTHAPSKQLRGTALDSTPTMRHARVSLKIVGADSSRLSGETLLETKTNYFWGNDSSRWRSNVPNFAGVRARAVLPGVDMVWHGGSGGAFEYDLDVKQGVDASKIAFEISGAESLRVRDDGSLAIVTSVGVLIEQPPKAIQAGHDTPTRFRMEGNGRVGLELDNYDRGEGIFIDPALVYSTYLGGSAGEEESFGKASVDPSGNVYLEGLTYSPDFPGTTSSPPGSAAAVLAKVKPDGSALEYATYLGPATYNAVGAVAVDAAGNAYVTGQALDGFPVVNAVQAFPQGGYEGFVAKVDSNGSTLIYSSYLGGSGNDYPCDIAVDAAGSAYIVGYTMSKNFPTHNPYQSTRIVLTSDDDAFVTKLAPDGSSFVYSTYLGGAYSDRAFGVSVDEAGSAYVVGDTSSTDFPTANAAQTTIGSIWDAYVTKFSPDGSSLVFSTYYGSANYQEAYDVALDSADNVYIAGSVFVEPTSTFLATAAKLKSDGSVFDYKTTFGIQAQGYGIAVDALGSAYVVGAAWLPSFPTIDPIQSCDVGSDAFEAKLDSTGTLTSATCLGGSANDSAWDVGLDGAGNIYVTGGTTSPNFPVSAALQPALNGASDFFITKIGAGTTPLTLLPLTASTSPLGSVGFRAFGGSGGGYVYTLQQNQSDGGIDGGAYNAGTIPNTTDVVLVTDSANNTKTSTVTIGPGLGILPVSASTSPKGSVSFSATGGSGSYTWSVPTNLSGATIDATTGAYVAGSTPNVTDVVEVDDSVGSSVQATVSVGAALLVAPASTTVAPKQGVVLTASGGSGAGLSWSLTLNNSAATLDAGVDASTASYVAGSVGNVMDNVTASDSVGNSGTSVITIGPGVSIVPAMPATAPRGHIAFAASGGSDAGFAWSITTNGSGGSIDLDSGAYVAGSTGNSVDTVRVTDSLTNVASVNVSVGGGLAINPASATVKPAGSVHFTAAGGSGSGYVWSLSTNASGGRIDSTGNYAAGSRGGVDDAVRVEDALGNHASVDVHVLPDPDAGSPSADAGTTPSTDAGLGTSTGQNGAAGGGGCGCSMIGGGTENTGVAGAWCLLGALAMRRRARRLRVQRKASVRGDAMGL